LEKGTGKFFEPLKVIHHKSQYTMVRDTMRIDGLAKGFVRITIPSCRRHIFHTDLPMGQIVGESDIGRENWSISNPIPYSVAETNTSAVPKFLV
jgi:hypothetical protein